MKKFFSALICLLFLFAAPSMGSIMSVTYTDSIEVGTAGWEDTVSIPKFDASLGELTGITFSLTGHVSGSAGFENMMETGTAALIEMDLKATLKLQRPDGSILVISVPIAQTSDTNVPSFDGVLDYAGTSGKTYEALGSTQTELFATADPADFLLFTGAGNILLPVVTFGNSSGSGPGDVNFQFRTSTSADVAVTYHYIPEPATLGLLALGVVGLIRRRSI